MVVLKVTDDFTALVWLVNHRYTDVAFFLRKSDVLHPTEVGGFQR